VELSIALVWVPGVIVGLVLSGRSAAASIAARCHAVLLIAALAGAAAIFKDLP
jgi:hypothetical protein